MPACSYNEEPEGYRDFKVPKYKHMKKKKEKLDINYFYFLD